MLLALIVSSIAIGATVLLGVLGYLIDKNAERAERKPEGNAAPEGNRG
jgi:hypothetical protein